MESQSDNPQGQAFIIVNGADIYPLEKEVVNIGRMEDNDIVLEGAHISRYHVQIRFEDGRHRLVDLQSTSGTSVNQQPVEEKWLDPGDVISLAGVPMIYGRTKGAASFRMMQTGETPGPASVRRTLEATDSIDIETIDRYMEMFDPPENS